MPNPEGQKAEAARSGSRSPLLAMANVAEYAPVSVGSPCHGCDGLAQASPLLEEGNGSLVYAFSSRDGQYIQGEQCQGLPSCTLRAHTQMPLHQLLVLFRTFINTNQTSPNHLFSHYKIIFAANPHFCSVSMSMCSTLIQMLHRVRQGPRGFCCLF